MSTFAGRNVLRTRLSTCSSLCVSVRLSLCLFVCLSVCLSVHLFVVRQRLKPVPHDVVRWGDWVDFSVYRVLNGLQLAERGWQTVRLTRLGRFYRRVWTFRRWGESRMLSLRACVWWTWMRDSASHRRPQQQQQHTDTHSSRTRTVYNIIGVSYVCLCRHQILTKTLP